MTMKGEPVPPEGLDHIKALQKWLEQYPNDVMVRSKLADLQRDPRFVKGGEKLYQQGCRRPGGPLYLRLLHLCGPPLGDLA